MAASTWRLVCCLAAVILSGCAKNSYELTLTPKGRQIERQLACWVEGGGDKSKFSEVETARIDALYTARYSPNRAGSVGFRGVFGEAQPDDVGGKGTYTRYATSLGDGFAYVERFRGDDDAAAQFERRSAAAAELTRHVKAWAAREFKLEPDYARLEKYLDREFARDALNLSLFLGPISGSSIERDVLQGAVGNLPEKARNELRERKQGDILLRACQYLSERDFLGPAQVPQIARAAASNRWHDAIADMVERKLGRGPDHPRGTFALLRDPERLNASIDSYLRDTAEYKAVAERHVDPPPPTVVIEPILKRLVDDAFVMSSDHLTVYLHLTVEPHRSNGTWNHTQRRLEWSSNSIDEKYPSMCYAFWSEANDAAQKARFGRTILSGERLMNYALWYRGLTPQEAKHWDEYLAKLEPGPQLRHMIENFHFQDESEMASAGRADALREILIPVIEMKP